ncbi:hypothetical protein VNI00_010688 [Paramarasmius palmivorus]|uniref:Yeast cell wall synthesis Kre9/Knh1-like N-terminal domain-containing protein n=1 Tax=Paramarasmius palmivorus TaxID=297713 RepID=A0AAW0CLA3_9AGAR
MVAASSFTFLLASFAAVGVHAIVPDVSPTEPTPGTNYTSKCHIQWDKDQNGKWKDMSIQLMTGNNIPMTHLTTVATGLDGTTAGKFDYDCPKVTPNSQIYFYQFSAPGANGVLTWTGRFTITDADGNSVPPENTGTDGLGQPFLWGMGQLEDPSSAKPPPDYLATGTTGNSNSTTSASAGDSGDSGSSSSAPVLPTSAPTSGPDGSAATTGNNNPQSSGSPNSSGQGNAANNTTENRDNGAVSVSVSRAWQATLAIAVSASAFAVLL